MSKYLKKYNCFPSLKNKAKLFRMNKQKNDLILVGPVGPGGAARQHPA